MSSTPTTATVRTVSHITSRAARDVLDAATEAAQEAGQPSAIAVVDASGELVAFTRLDGAAVQAGQIARDKAYTAAGFGMPSGAWQDLFAQDTPLTTSAGTAIDRFAPLGGGLPLVVDDAVVGAVGVSGGHWSGDVAIAEAAVAALA